VISRPRSPETVTAPEPRELEAERRGFSCREEWRASDDMRRTGPTSRASSGRSLRPRRSDVVLLENRQQSVGEGVGGVVLGREKLPNQPDFGLESAEIVPRGRRFESG
jgi:hypothetical protein